MFLDRYEGIKPLRAELSFSRLTNIKPFEMYVVSSMDPENRTQSKISISYFQTIGHLRAKIASELGLEIN